MNTDMIIELLEETIKKIEEGKIIQFNISVTPTREMITTDTNIGAYPMYGYATEGWITTKLEVTVKERAPK